MKEEVIGRRYAKALIQLGQEQGTWEEIGKNLGDFVALLNENEALRKVLSDPIHDRKKRKAILQGILTQRFAELGQVIIHHDLCEVGILMVKFDSEYITVSFP